MIAFSLTGRLGMTLQLDTDPVTGTIDVAPPLCHGGALRASLLMLLADLAAGVPDDIDDPDAWHLTTDFALRTLGPPARGRVTARARSLRRGKTSTSAEVHMVDAQERPVAYSQIGFARRPVGPDDPPKPDLAAAPSRIGGHPLIEVPLTEAAGIQVVDATEGHVSCELTPELRNPAGVMQGAMVSLVAEVAAEELATATHGRTHVVRDLDIRYLMGGREGPVTSSARWLGDPADGWMTVELRDQGRAGRLMTAAMARCTPAPSA